ncbi:ribokinase [Salipaludibacillus aurantiacus]|uniref:Deoxyribokinase n=2 Tax=Salipaludibacillus aurantiacus TaxID=1601833 RepID=A0A1H9W2X1_9BACI|nr:ribokinase [Salipaludibacillus aurantiacus]
MITEVDELPKPGETVIGSNVTYSHGGKGANQILAANLFFQGVEEVVQELTFIGAIGMDDRGHRLKTHFSDCGICPDYIQQKPDVNTGMAQILVDKHGENSIVVSPEANYRLTPEDVEESLYALKKVDLLLIQFEIPMETAVRSIECMKDQEGLVVVNPAPAFPIDPHLYPVIDFLTPNLNELSILTGVSHFTSKEDIKTAALKLIHKGVKNVIVTMGSDGVLYANKDSSSHFEAPRVKAVDTSGAGDCFNGVFCASLVKGNSIDESIKDGMLYAGLSVTRKGTSISYPDHHDVCAFLR